MDIDGYKVVVYDPSGGPVEVMSLRECVTKYGESTQPNRAPLPINPVRLANAVVGSNYKATLPSTTDPDGDPINYVMGDAPNGLTYSGLELLGNALEPGDYQIHYVAMDSKGAATPITAYLTVDPAPDEPQHFPYVLKKVADDFNGHPLYKAIDQTGVEVPVYLEVFNTTPLSFVLRGANVDFKLLPSVRKLTNGINSANGGYSEPAIPKLTGTVQDYFEGDKREYHRVGTGPDRIYTAPVTPIPTPTPVPVPAEEPKNTNSTGSITSGQTTAILTTNLTN